MEPRNNYLQVEPLKDGFIAASEGNVYRIISTGAVGEMLDYKNNDLIVIEDQLVIKISANGAETYFVNHENILAVMNGPKKDN